MLRARLRAESIAAQRAVRQTLGDAAFHQLLELDITLAQLKALAAVQRQPTCSIGMLSEQLGIKPSASSLIVDRLVRAGLASRERDRADGRRVIVRPTAQGARLLDRIRHGTQALMENWVRQLGDDDLAALHRGSIALARVATGFSALVPSRGGERA